MPTETQILKDIAMVMVHMTIWSGAKKLEPSDFINVDAHDLPSEKVASYGIKHLINKERLSPIKALRSRADRVCMRYGTRLLGGYAVPQDSIDIIGNELQQICAEFDAEIDKFMLEYDVAIEDWIQSNPDFAEPLRRSVLPRAAVRNRFHASFSIFEVSASPRDTTNSMNNVNHDLLESVLADVVMALKPRIERKDVVGADSFRVEVRETITELAQKILRFSFMDLTGGMRAFAERLEASVQGTGTIKGKQYDDLLSIIGNLTTVEAVKRAFEAHQPFAVPATQPSQDTKSAEIVTIKGDMGFAPGTFEDERKQVELDLPLNFDTGPEEDGSVHRLDLSENDDDEGQEPDLGNLFPPLPRAAADEPAFLPVFEF